MKTFFNKTVEDPPASLGNDKLFTQKVSAQESSTEITPFMNNTVYNA